MNLMAFTTNKSWDTLFMHMALEEAHKAWNLEEVPVGAVLVDEHAVVLARSHNRTILESDPTAHAEIVAIKKACEKLGVHQLEDCIIYTSCEPCPMCLGAIYWARPKSVYYACNREDASKVDFDDQLIYEELQKKMIDRQIKFSSILREEALKVFRTWSVKMDKTNY